MSHNNSPDRTLLGALGRFANAMLLLLFGLGYLSVFLPPEWFWWTGLPASLLPFLATGVLIVALIHFTTGTWGAFILHIVLVGLFVMRAGGLPFETFDAPPTDEDRPILTVMSYNYTPFERGQEVNDRLRNTLGDLATTYEPNLIAMQSIRVFQQRGETRFVDQLDTLATIGYYAAPEQNTAPHLDTRVPLLRKSAPASHQEPIVLEAQEGTDRHIMRSELEWGGDTIVVYNVHLRSFERSHALDLIRAEEYGAGLLELLSIYRRDVLHRAREARELRRLLDAETKPLLVIGDLNASPFNWEYRHIRGARNDAAAQLGGNWMFTWHTKFPVARIDHVITSKHWQPVSLQVDSTTISDHYPLIMELQRSE